MKIPAALSAIVCLIVSFQFNSAFAQTPSMAWARSAGGINEDRASAATTDRDGNVIITGYFASPTITFGNDTLINQYSWCSIYVTKYDAQGNVLWARAAGGTSISAGGNQGTSVATDAGGNIYVTGYYGCSSITFGSYTLNSYGAFLVKYDSQGTVVWAKNIPGTVEGKGVATDGDGNVYITGDFQSKVIPVGSYTLINASATDPTNDVFIAKYGPNGNVLWAKSAGGGNHEVSGGIAVDINGNAYITGGYGWNFGFTGTYSMNFNGLTITKTDTFGTYDIFVAKYNTNGNILWAKSYGGGDSDIGRTITTDLKGNVIIGGYFRSATISFGNETLVYNPIYQHLEDAFVLKCDANGDALWVRASGGNSSDEVRGVATDTSENVFVTGDFSSYYFKFGNDTLMHLGTNNYSTNFFVMKYNEDGNVQWAMNIGENGHYYGVVPATDIAGNLYVPGFFTGGPFTFGSETLINANPDSADVTLVKTDAFLVKFSAREIPISTSTTQTICIGDSFTFGTELLSTSGVYYDTFATSSGTDSTVQLTLLVEDPQPVILQDGNLLTTGHFSAYSWRVEGSEDIIGITKQIYIQKAGIYHLDVVDSNGCSASTSFSVINVDIGEITNEQEVMLYPNPNTGDFILQFSDDAQREITIADLLGKTVTPNLRIRGSYTFTLNMPAGIYFLRIKEEGKVIKFTVRDL